MLVEVIAIIVAVLIVLYVLGTKRGDPDPSKMSVAWLVNRHKSETEWTSNFLFLPFKSQQSESLSKAYDRRKAYIEQIESELAKRPMNVTSNEFADVTGILLRRLEKRKKSHMNKGLSEANAVELATAELTGLPSLPPTSSSPTDIGQRLCMDLDYSCKIEQVSVQERALLAAANIPIDRYFAEVFALAGFARDYAIVKLLGNAGVGKEVREGYLEIWTKVWQEDLARTAVYRLFIQRCPGYAKAAERIQPGEAVDSIGLEFSGFLAQNNSHARQLALTYAPMYYIQHFESTRLSLHQAKLT